jgi:hypothetical protein
VMRHETTGRRMHPSDRPACTSPPARSGVLCLSSPDRRRHHTTFRVPFFSPLNLASPHLKAHDVTPRWISQLHSLRYAIAR